MDQAQDGGGGGGVDEHRHQLPEGAVERAAQRIAGRVAHTPLLGSRTAAQLIAERTGVRLGAPSGGGTRPRLFLKAEHLQVTGSFKPRGACNKLLELTAEERQRGLITLSAGNHAQAVAYAAAAEGIPVTVVMPIGASPAKAAAAAAYGAEVVLHGQDVGETFARMEELRDERGLVFVHPFDDPAVIAGQGTVGLEILEDLPDVDVIVVGVGGGGLISGIATAVGRARPATRIYGVEPVGSSAMTSALAAGSVIPVQPVSIADGLGAPFAGARTLDIVRQLVEAVVLVEEAVIANGVRFALERMKQVLEPAGAAALGALLAGRIPLDDDATVCVVASGGNLDLERLPAILDLAGPRSSTGLT
ncbi:MAG: pyridoxal-phosphate dependent enzyme [Chloroflexi bacterium]|nr:pyridoxal-phosphate dependent enzyme [Chloroflexota bacterium]